VDSIDQDPVNGPRTEIAPSQGHAFQHYEPVSSEASEVDAFQHGNSSDRSRAARYLAAFEIVEVSSIAVPKRASPLNDAVVEQLIKSIQRRGLLYPPLVICVPNSDAYLLVVGAHRLEALRRLGLVWVPVIVREGDPEEVEMDQLEENLARKELSVLERAFQEQRLFDLYKTKHPNTVRGKAGAVARHGGANENSSFAEAMSRPRSGKRSVQYRLQLSRNLNPEAAAALYGTPVANNRGALIALSKLPSAEQPKLATVLGSGAAANVDEAKRLVSGLPLLVSPPRSSKVTAPLERTETGYLATASFLGHKVVVTIREDHPSVTLEDSGPAAPHRGYIDDQNSLSVDGLQRVLGELVAELPTPISKDVTVGQPRVDTWVVEVLVQTRFPGTEKTRGMRLRWWLQGGTDKDGVLLPGSDAEPSVPVVATLYGSLTIGKFRREFRAFFSKYILVSTHRTTDAFAQVEKRQAGQVGTEDVEDDQPKGPKKAKPKGGPGPKKSPNSPDVVAPQLRYALRMQGFKPNEVKRAVDHLKPRIDGREDLAGLIVDAIQFLTPSGSRKS